MVEVNNENMIIVSGKVNMQKLNSRQFVRPEKKHTLLPYFDKLDENLDSHLQQLINGLISSVLAENTIDSASYCKQFVTYITEFGLRMSKQTFLDLVKFFYEAIIKKDQHYAIIEYCGSAVESVLSCTRHGQFTSHDLLLDWRPLFDLYVRVYYDKVRKLSTAFLNESFIAFSVYFSPEEQPYIWNSILEHLSIGVTMKLFSKLCSIFLSVEGLTMEEHVKYGCGVWFPDLWTIYISAEMNNEWGNGLAHIFTRIVVHVPEVIDWTPFYNTIFTKVIRSFDLSIREGKTMIGDGSESLGVVTFAQFLAYSIGGPKSSTSHFDRTLKCIEFSLHPLNSGCHVHQIETFLDTFLQNFTARVRRERFKKVKRMVSLEYYLKDEDIDDVARIIVDAAVMLLFSPDASYKKVSLILYHLTSLNVGLVGPKILDHIYSAIFAYSEPQRLSTTMDALVFLIFQLIRDSKEDLNNNVSVKFGIDWLKRMEEERLNWPTFIEGSQLKNEIKDKSFGTFRHHAIYILEIFVNSIDINDVGRAEAALKTLLLVFTSIPIMDFSESAKHHSKDMTEEDKLLCKLSKRIPTIIEVAFEKILKTIECLAIGAPKDSCKVLGGMHDFETISGTDETVLKQSIDECVSAMFSHADVKLTEKLFDKLFQFVTTIEFESFTATDLLSGIISSCVWINDDAWKKFAEFVHKKLKVILTDEMSKLKEPPTSVLYYSVLAQALFSAKSNVILQNEGIICDVVSLLIGSQCRTIHTIGSKGLGDVLSTLTDVYTSVHQGPIDLFRKSLSEWNPVKEWARCYTLEEMVLKWYIPSKKELDCVQRLANKFFFPLVELMDKGSSERDELRRVSNSVVNILMGLVDVLRFPESEGLRSGFMPDCSLLVSSSLGECEKTEWELLTPNGMNTREFLLSKIESLLKNPKVNDPKVMESITAICIILVDDHVVNKAKLKAQKKLMSATYAFLSIPIFGDMNKAVFDAMQGSAFEYHLNVAKYATECSKPATKYDLRVLKCLFQLGLNDYESIRTMAHACIQVLSDKALLCRYWLMDDVLDVISNPDVKNEETIKGALATIIATNWSESVNAAVRKKLWSALLKMRVIDEPNIRKYFDAINVNVIKIEDTPMLPQSDPNTFEERSRKCWERGMELLKLSNLKEWEGYVSDDGLKRHREQLLKWQNDMKRIRLEMVDDLLKSYVRNINLHHTREKLARTMLFRCQREAAGVKTIEILLAQLINEEEDLRAEAVSELAVWFLFNKPKTKRDVFIPPKKVENGVKLECGIRQDNMCIVYDSMNLPNTEEKWNEMVFVEKTKGSYKWPSCVSVVRKAKNGPPLESRILSEAESAILKWFESEENVNRWLSLRMQEKEAEDAGINVLYYTLIKYVIRNFPDSSKALGVFQKCLHSLFRSKKREGQMLAAEVLIGVTFGMKHRPFKVLEEFWNWCAPEIDRFFDVVSTEAKEDWKEAIESIININSDLRRIWWLVEMLIVGAKRANTEEWRQALRLQVLRANRWRYMEISNRVCEIAWTKLSIAITDTLRVGISRPFQNVSILREMNWNNTYKDVELRFQVLKTDTWIERFVENIPQIQSKTNKVQSSKSDQNLLSIKEKVVKKGRRSKSPNKEISEEIIEKRSLIFFRTLLEFLQRYYFLCSQSWSPAIITILPKLFEYANEDAYEFSEEAYKNVDIIQNSSYLIEMMSSLWLSSEYIDRIIETLINTYHSNVYAWRVRLAVLKFLQVIVYSNMFEFKEVNRCAKVEKLVFEAVGDSSISVRKEAAKCLLLFIHCEYIVIDDTKVASFSTVLNDKKESNQRKHGAALALGALVMAFPFSLPPVVLKPLKVLSSTTTRLAIVQNTVTEALREFQRQHRDDWVKTKKVLGDQLVFEIENATAPVYYA